MKTVLRFPKNRLAVRGEASGLPFSHWIEADLYGLLGTPLKRSLSPAMHNAHFRYLGINAVYYPFEIGLTELSSVLPALESLRFKGLNITMPLKQAIVPFLHHLDEMGELCQSVNTIRIHKGNFIGTNTDGMGFARALVEQGHFEPAGKTCTLFGSGGAARGIAFALARAGMAHFNILDRQEARNLRLSLASDLNAYASGCSISKENTLEHAQRALEESDLIINATCVGMAPDVDATVFETSLLRPRHFVADVVYTPHKTRLLQEARSLGCRVLEGHWMTLWQGIQAFEFWTGQKGAPHIMSETLNGLLSNQQTD